MSSRTPEERFAIWNAYGGICYWCKERVPYVDCQIDHVIPERLSQDPKELEKVKSDLALPNNFNINGLENLVPSHGLCNRIKSGDVYKPTPLVMSMLREVKNKVGVVARI